MMEEKLPDLLEQVGYQGEFFFEPLLQEWQRGSRLQLGIDAPAWAREILPSCFALNPNERPTFTTILRKLMRNEPLATVEVQSQQSALAIPSQASVGIDKKLESTISTSTTFYSLNSLADADDSRPALPGRAGNESWSGEAQPLLGDNDGDGDKNLRASNEGCVLL